MPHMEAFDVPTRDGAVLAAQRLGSGPILLLLPGQANSHVWWDELRRPFAERFTTVTFDYRGTGTTTAIEDDWSIPLFATDAAAVLDAVGASTARVYATSMGGRVAQVLAGTTDRVERLVLACTTPGHALGTERDGDVRHEMAFGGARAILDLMYTPAWFARGRRSLLLGDSGMTPAARRLHLRASDAHDASGVLERISAPTLVLHGTDDRMAPASNAEVLHEHIRGSRLELTPGGRHGFFDEFADAVTPRVLDFLDH